MTDDRFLHSLRRDPRPEFARGLAERLRAIEEPEEARGFRLQPALVAVFAAAAVAVLLLLPSVRVSAQAMLDLFRVRQFAVVEIDPKRLESLHALRDDDGMRLMFEQEVTVRPGPEQEFTTPEAAGAAAGLTLEKLTEPARDMKPGRISVEGAGAGNLILHEAKVQALLDQLGITDIRVPPGFDGQRISVHRPPVAKQEYVAGKNHAVLVQAKMPEVGLPPGADLARLGEVGLRVLGLDAGEARRIAGSIDWHSTLVIPVPLNASTFRPVTIRGNQGILITLTGNPSVDGGRRGTMVMWTEGDRMVALKTNLEATEAVEMAETVH